ncbi:MAG: hypothetical protein ACMUIG_03155 [Thermoplasmatota archaeon]
MNDRKIKGTGLLRFLIFLISLSICIISGIVLIGLLVELGFSIIFAVILEVFFILLIVYILHRNIKRILGWISGADEFEVGGEE